MPKRKKPELSEAEEIKGPSDSKKLEKAIEAEPKVQDIRPLAQELYASIVNRKKPAVAPKKAAAKPPCRHPHLHFENGGLHIICGDCKRAWVAVLEPYRIIQDVMARAQGLTDLDRRSDPSAPPPSISKR